MEGQRFSHYQILERLGGGGMGVVYKALDTKLNRHVALKFLPHELTRDDEARTRFIQEAQAASALDHPNICTIHEIDTTPDGQMFIAMAFYDGETLKKRIDRGALPVTEALDIAGQIAQGLTKAHSAGIVHRDVKPANVMVTSDGFVKIVDFGVAKLLGVTGPTQAGSTLGTVSYMAPEQVGGEEADPRSDVWALGAVLYEMLTGQLPFRGENQWAVMNAIANSAPEPIRSLRPEVPEVLEAVVTAALTKERSERIGSTEELRSALRATGLATPEGAIVAAGASGVPRRRVLTPATAIAGSAAAILIVGTAAWLYGNSSDVRWAREEALPQIQQLVSEDRVLEAFDLAADAEEYIPGDLLLAELWANVSLPGSIVTEPEDAAVSFRPYGAGDDAWRYLGRSPIREVRVPRGVFEWRIEKDGYETRVWAAANPSQLLHNLRPGVPGISVPLSRVGEGSADMVTVPPVAGAVSISGFNAGTIVELDGFLIDRYEVTNRQFKEFVDAGGYDDRRYWEGLEFVEGGRTLTYEEAIGRFIDSTGRPGPATWEAGDYPDGQAEHPVSGVSWYEAMAYARFAGRNLPTVYHWSFAALAPGEIISPIGPAIVPKSNFGGEGGPAPVGSSGAMGPYGTFDTAGNVREWCLNASGDLRWILGGAHSDPPYMFSMRFALPPMDRSRLNGFRTVSYAGEVSAELSAPIEYRSRDYRDVPPVSDEVYEIYSSQLSYESSELSAVVGETKSSDDWVMERVSFNAGYDGERIEVIVYLPTAASPPHQALILFPGLNAFQNRQSSEALAEGPIDAVDFLLTSGRAFVIPVWKGSYERWDPFLGLSGLEYETTLRERMSQWRRELGMTIDYLAQRDDIDEGSIGYVGISFGASTPLALLAVEDRLRTAVLVSGGFSYRALPDAVHPVSFVDRTTLPVLMINGRYDYVFPLETGPIAYFDRLGTPMDDKRLEIVEAGHWPLPRGQFIGTTLDWLDEYLGPTD